MPRLGKVILAAVAVGAVLMTATTAGAAVASGQSGTVTSVQKFVGSSDPWTINTVTTWSDVPGATVNVDVPAGSPMFIDARFTAESLCAGSPGAWCSVRVVYNVSPSGPELDLLPVTGPDYKFDTPGGAEHAGALERYSATLNAGLTYTVRVQALRMSGITQFTLDDYAFAVGLVKP
jgi:hypothetical protein